MTSDEEITEFDQEEEDYHEHEERAVPPPIAHTCSVCLIGPLQVLTLPCKHLVMCIACSERLVLMETEQSHKCVVCRAAIVERMNVYMN